MRPEAFRRPSSYSCTEADISQNRKKEGDDCMLIGYRKKDVSKDIAVVQTVSSEGPVRLGTFSPASNNDLPPHSPITNSSSMPYLFVRNSKARTSITSLPGTLEKKYSHGRQRHITSEIIKTNHVTPDVDKIVNRSESKDLSSSTKASPDFGLRKDNAVEKTRSSSEPMTTNNKHSPPVVIRGQGIPGKFIDKRRKSSPAGNVYTSLANDITKALNEDDSWYVNTEHSNSSEHSDDETCVANGYDTFLDQACGVEGDVITTEQSQGKQAASTCVNNPVSAGELVDKDNIGACELVDKDNVGTCELVDKDNIGACELSDTDMPSKQGDTPDRGSSLSLSKDSGIMSVGEGSLSSLSRVNLSTEEGYCSTTSQATVAEEDGFSSTQDSGISTNSTPTPSHVIKTNISNIATPTASCVINTNTPTDSKPSHMSVINTSPSTALGSEGRMTVVEFLKYEYDKKGAKTVINESRVTHMHSVSTTNQHQVRASSEENLHTKSEEGEEPVSDTTENTQTSPTVHSSVSFPELSKYLDIDRPRLVTQVAFNTLR